MTLNGCYIAHHFSSDLPLYENAYLKKLRLHKIQCKENQNRSTFFLNDLEYNTLCSTTILVTSEEKNLLSCREIIGHRQMVGATQGVGGPKSKNQLFASTFSLYAPTGIKIFITTATYMIISQRKSVFYFCNVT